MNHWFKKKITALILLGIIFLCALIYRDSFNSPFFQDDKVLFSMASNDNWWKPLLNFPYRPVSQTLFYRIGLIFFGYQVLPYHILLYAIFCISIYFFYKITSLLSTNKRVSLIATFLYVFNVSLFANFYWVATSYFVIGSLFFYASVFCYLKRTNLALLFSILFFILGIFSNELCFVLPGIFILLDWRQSKLNKKSFILVFLTIFLVFLRYLSSGLPTSSAYQFVFGLDVLRTTKWYLLRAFNLPEGMRGVDAYVLTVFLTLFLTGLLFGLKNSLQKNSKYTLKMIIFSFLWFGLSALPFFFVPYHMSSYYLTMALLGPSFLFSSLLSEIKKKKIILVLLLIYISMTIIGLNFLSQTHWIILKNTGPIGQF